MKTIGIVSLHPDCLDILKAVIKEKEKEPLEIVIPEILKLSGLLDCEGKKHSVVPISRLEEIRKYVESKKGVLITEKRISSISQNEMVLEELFSWEETGLRYAPRKYRLKMDKIMTVLEGERQGETKSIQRRKSLLFKPEEEISIPVRKLWYFPPFEMGSLPKGSGLNKMIAEIGKSLKSACEIAGYEFMVSTEAESISKDISKEDTCVFVCANGFWQGGFSAPWFGVHFEKLENASRKAKRVMIICSIHPSEFILYGAPPEWKLKELNKNTDYYVFHANRIREIENKVKKKVDIFPVCIGNERRIIQKRVATDSKVVLFQLDAQPRKNGVMMLCSIIDAFVLASKERNNLHLEIICKSTAPGSFKSDKVLKELLKRNNLDNIENLSVRLVGIESHTEWEKTIERTDIFVALSLEEGIHYFVEELWQAGAKVLVPEWQKETFGRLKDVFCVETNRAYYWGFGNVNDVPLSEIDVFSYNSAVLKLKELLVTDLTIESKSMEDCNFVLDTNGELVLKFI